MLRIENVDLSTDTPLAGARAETIAHAVAGAIDRLWSVADARRPLSIARLVIDAGAAELSQPDFAQRVARATVTRLRDARERG